MSSRQIFVRQYVIQTVIRFVPAQANTLAFITYMENQLFRALKNKQ
jgi:hypothetical protein